MKRWVTNRTSRLVGILCVTLLVSPRGAVAEITEVPEITWEKSDRNAFDELRLQIVHAKPQADVRILVTLRPGEVNVVVEPVRKAIPGLPAKLDQWRVSQGLQGPVKVETGEWSMGLSHSEGMPGLMRWQRDIDLAALANSLQAFGEVGLGVSTSEHVSGSYVRGTNIQDGAFSEAKATVLEPQIIAPRAELTPLGLFHVVGVVLVLPLVYGIASVAAARLRKHPQLTDAQKRESYQRLSRAIVLLPIFLHAGVFFAAMYTGLWDLIGRLWFQLPGTQVMMAFLPLGLLGVPLALQQFEREGEGILSMSAEEEWNLVRNESGQTDSAHAEAPAVYRDGLRTASHVSLAAIAAVILAMISIPDPRIAILVAQAIGFFSTFGSWRWLILRSKRAKSRSPVTVAQHQHRLDDSLARCAELLRMPRMRSSTRSNPQSPPLTAHIRAFPREMVVGEHALTELTNDELDHLVLHNLVWYRDGGFRARVRLSLISSGVCVGLPFILVGLLRVQGGSWGVALPVLVGAMVGRLVWRLRTDEPKRQAALATEAEAIRILAKPHASLSFLRKLAASQKLLLFATSNQGPFPSLARRIAQAESMLLAMKETESSATEPAEPHHRTLDT